MKGADTALYRKYRPQAFTEVLGQEHITKVLEGSIKLNRISHAYLFSGSRGTGKTSVARILAREIGVSSNDTYEIDAASNTGVDDIRALNESVNVLPFESKYKVYIVDEVHMLSKSAFNALLKTLEEPPAHVIFILATTEAEKLPETIISRCQTFTFRRPSQKVLKDVVIKTAKHEGFTLEPSSGDLIALLADGSFRDALGTLQKVVSASKDKKISVEEVETVTGAPRAQLINDFLLALEGKKLEDALSLLRQSLNSNIEAKVFMKLLLRKLRFVLLLQYAPAIEQTIAEEVSEDDLEFLKKLSGKKDSGLTPNVLSELLEAFNQMHYSYLPEIPIELALMRIVSQKR